MNEERSKRPWEDLVFSIIEKLTTAPSKLKDPKESVSAAVEWVKSVRQEVQEKMVHEIKQSIIRFDWEKMGRKVMEELVQEYDIEISSKILFRPKKQRAAKKYEKTENSEST